MSFLKRYWLWIVGIIAVVWYVNRNGGVSAFFPSNTGPNGVPTTGAPFA